MSDEMNTVWVFKGPRATFASGVFSTRELAEKWIQEFRLTGTLTCYPVDIPVYEWSIQKGLFKPTKPKHETAEFIQTFSSAGQEHYHYEDGVC